MEQIVTILSIVMVLEDLFATIRRFELPPSRWLDIILTISTADQLLRSSSTIHIQVGADQVSSKSDALIKSQLSIFNVNERLTLDSDVIVDDLTSINCTWLLKSRTGPMRLKTHGSTPVSRVFISNSVRTVSISSFPFSKLTDPKQYLHVFIVIVNEWSDYFVDHQSV